MLLVSLNDREGGLIIQMTKSSDSTIENHGIRFTIKQFYKQRESFVSEEPCWILHLLLTAARSSQLSQDSGSSSSFQRVTAFQPQGSGFEDRAISVAAERRDCIPSTLIVVVTEEGLIEKVLYRG